MSIRFRRAILPVLLLSLLACEQRQSLSGCTFPPPDSKWPTLDCTTCNWSCVNCFMNIDFMGKDYAFDVNTIDREPGCYYVGDSCQHNREYYFTPFFAAWQVVPESFAALQQTVGVKMPLRKYDDGDGPRPASPEASLQLTDYCKHTYEVADDQTLDESYNLITGYTKRDSARAMINNKPTDYFDIDFTGEIETNFKIDGHLQPLHATYQLTVYYERKVE